MRIAIGSDRRGFIAKEKLIAHLRDEGYEVNDCGPYDSSWPVDYPIYGKKVGEEVSDGKVEFGIVICATGNGIMMAANKTKGIRCGMGYCDEAAVKMRQHNDANMISFGQDLMNYEEIERRADLFLTTGFAGGHHCSRI